MNGKMNIFRAAVGVVCCLFYYLWLAGQTYSNTDISTSRSVLWIFYSFTSANYFSSLINSLVNKLNYTVPVFFFSKEHFKIQICNIFANRIDPAHIFANILLNFFRFFKRKYTLNLLP